MSILYINEVVNFAIEREKESYALYQELAEKTTDAEIRQLFTVLKEEEQQHKTFYEKMLSALEKKNSPGVQENEEYVKYMQALIEQHRVLSKKEQANTDDLKQAVNYAIDREKDAVIFYVGLKNFVNDSDIAMIDNIISEEARHIARLLDIKGMIS